MRDSKDKLASPSYLPQNLSTAQDSFTGPHGQSAGGSNAAVAVGEGGGAAEGVSRMRDDFPAGQEIGRDGGGVAGAGDEGKSSNGGVVPPRSGGPGLASPMTTPRPLLTQYVKALEVSGGAGGGGKGG